MGVVLWDLTDPYAKPHWMQSRSWPAIVEAIRRLDLLPDARVSLLNDVWNPAASLSQSEARDVAAGLRAGVITTLHDNDYLLLDGTTTTEADDTIYHDAENTHRNYSTTRGCLIAFCDYCKTCNGFAVRE